jgi:HSP20 family protein
MGIIDKISGLLPWRGERRTLSSATDGLALRDDVDRWLQRLLDDPWGLPAMVERGRIPSAEIDETDDEVVVTVEVPGFDRDELDLTITSDGLTVQGEKREETADERRGVYVAERRHGRFIQTVPLPSGVDVDRASARVSNGLLTVRFPRAGDRAGVRRIPIKT